MSLLQDQVNTPTGDFHYGELMETLTDILSHSWRNVLSRELDEMQDRYRIRCSFDRLTLKGYNHRDLFVVRSRGEGLWQADRFKG